MDVEKYRQLFLDECREHLQGMNRELLRLEAEEEFDGIDTLFREAHSIKGMAGSMGYRAMSSLSHALEDVLDGIRKKTLAVSGDLISLLFEGVDLLGQLADEVEVRGSTSLDVGGLEARLKEMAGGRGKAAAASPGPAPSGEGIGPGEEGEQDLPEAEVVEGEGPWSPGPEEKTKLLELAREGKRAFLCRVTVREDTASLTARNFVVLGKLNKAGSIVTSRPSLSEVLAGKGSVTMDIFLGTARSEDEIAALLGTVPELAAVEVLPLQAGSLAPAAGPGAGEAAGPATGPSRGDAARKLIEKYLPGRSTTVRVDTRILDDLVNIVGELIVSRDRLLDVSQKIEDESLHSSLDRLDLLVKGFRDTIMAVRMMPLEIVTDRLPRLVRDLARQGGKEIRFEILGQGIELDRAILEELNDVLVHLVRNAIDHGIESVEERQAAGKAPGALVRISAERERDWVWIAVEDDGRGMDHEKILRTAVERGLVEGGKAGALARHEALLLICLPGLSTAAEVSDVSGRGVGMDVVKSKVESFGGSIQIDSAPGRGTKTTLRLPLTLAIVQALLVEAGGQLFALPVSHVAHAVRIHRSQVERTGGKAVVRWGGKVLDLGSLREFVGLAGETPRQEEFLPLVLTELDGRLSALSVDRLAGTCEAVIKPLGLPLKRVPGLAGAAVLADGRTVLVLDLKSLAARGEGRPAAPPHQGTVR